MLNVIINEVRAFLRSGTGLFFAIFFPCACIFVLGTFLEKVEVSDEAVGKLNIIYSTSDGSETSTLAFETFLRSMEDEGIFNEVREVSGDQLSPDFDPESVSAAVELSGDEIVIYGGSSDIQNRTIKAVFDSYSKSASSYYTAAVSGHPVMPGTSDAKESYVVQKDFGRTRSMMDYYAVTMAVMIIFMCSCISGANVYKTEHDCHTILRLNSSPVSKTAVFFGKIIGSMPMVLVQICTVMLVSTLLFGAKYCSTMSGNLLLWTMFITVSLAALSVGVLLDLFFPKMPTNLVLMPILWASMFLSGTFAMNIHVDGVSEHMPMYVIQRAAFDLTIFSRTEKAVNVIIVSLIIFAAALLTGWVKVNIRRKDK